jgi:peptidoglycan/xylan/chitin deacetylase (PgdA/CDA1 family)
MSSAVFLMYHQIGEAAAPADGLYTVSEEAFAAQTDHLLAQGYEVLSVGQALARPAARPRVVLTFDDGSASDRHVAAPRLAALGFGATFYVVAGYLGRPGFVTAEEARDLVGMGFEVGSHSMRHLYLSDLDDAALRDEVLGSKQRLEDALGRRVRHFACPGGRCNARVVKAVREAGYDSLATSHVGVNGPDADAFRLTRIAVQRPTALDEFARVCRGDGIAVRRVRELALGAAKTLLGNGRYDRVRRALLS